MRTYTGGGDSDLYLWFYACLGLKFEAVWGRCWGGSGSGSSGL